MDSAMGSGHGSLAMDTGHGFWMYIWFSKLILCFRKKRKAEKDPNKPKKPQSAFFLFLNKVILVNFLNKNRLKKIKNREQFTKKIGSKNPSELAKMASEKWKSMSDSDKAEFTVSFLRKYFSSL